ncbi:MAG: right-handed parallel beta-helix repeat-containing protein [Candidatus Thorarchaeota archaeon]
MKSKQSYEITIVLVLLFSSLVAMNSKIYNKVLNQQEIENSEKLKRSGQWIVSNIHVNNNWTAVNTTYDWCTYKNGYYVIENVSITGVVGISGIHIENTTENFIVRNCQIIEGIKLLRTKGGKIINNTIYFGYPGQWGVSRIGLFMKNCSDTIIRENYLNDTYSGSYRTIYGYLMQQCHNITIEANFLFTVRNPYDGFFRGIYLTEDKGNGNSKTINNTICGFDLGIETTVTKFNQFYNNNLYDCRIGLSISGVNQVISNNIIKCGGVRTPGRPHWGVYLGSSNSTLFGNKISEADWGIGIYDANDNIINNNSIQNISEHGMYVEGSNFNIIKNNSLQEMRGHGMYILESNYNNITNNEIQKAGQIGIYLDTCSYTTINGNYISYNLNCIVEINCHGNIIEDNSCIHIPSIFGYYPMLIIGILLMTTIVFIKFKLKKSK